MQPYMTLSADVLIVGGGSAGVMAAIRAGLDRSIFSPLAKR